MRKEFIISILLVFLCFSCKKSTVRNLAVEVTIDHAIIHFIDNAPNDIESQIFFSISFVNNSNEIVQLYDLENMKTSANKWLYFKFNKDSVRINKIYLGHDSIIMLYPQDTLLRNIVVKPLFFNVGRNAKEIFNRNQNLLLDNIKISSKGVFVESPTYYKEIEKGLKYDILNYYNGKKIDIDNNEDIFDPISYPEIHE